jgi:NAD(P)-dependent dehydrogenase (short-subunit alcohol dehydrogenase family)
VIGTVRDAKAKLPAGVEARVADVTRPEQVQKLAKELKGEPLDVLFCNAGIIGKRGSALGSFDYASWDELLRVNVLGAAACAEAFTEHVAASKLKVIAMMSSRLGSIAESSGVTLPYSTSKAALNMLVKGLSATLRDRGIVVVALSPGWVRTDMGGAGAPLDAPASVRGLRNVISGLKPSDSGAFFSHDGSRIPW